MQRYLENVSIEKIFAGIGMTTINIGDSICWVGGGVTGFLIFLFLVSEEDFVLRRKKPKYLSLFLVYGNTNWQKMAKTKA